MKNFKEKIISFFQLFDSISSLKIEELFDDTSTLVIFRLSTFSLSLILLLVLKSKLQKFNIRTSLKIRQKKNINKLKTIIKE